MPPAAPLRRLLPTLVLAPLLLAGGDVAVKQANGTLRLVGDEQDNRLVVEQVGPGDYLVTGLNGTTIDGAGSKLVHGVTKNLRVSLGKGGDLFSLQGDVAGRVVVRTGPGDDVVDVGDGAIGGSLGVATGSGNDFVEVTADVAGATRVSTGGGADEIGLAGVALLGRARVASGAGDDEVFVLDVFVGASLSVALGRGDDNLALASLAGGAFRADGGAGVDSTGDLGGHVLDQGPVLTSFEDSAAGAPAGEAAAP